MLRKSTLFYALIYTLTCLFNFHSQIPASALEVGDIVQLGRETGDFYHSPVVVGFSRGQILVAAHSYDAYNKPLFSYTFDRVRGLHILGVRKN